MSSWLKKTPAYKHGDIVKYIDRDGETRCGTIDSKRRGAGGVVIYSIRIARGRYVFRRVEDIVGKTDKAALTRYILEREREKAKRLQYEAKKDNSY